MAHPIRTPETIGIYGAPPGLEDVVEGLPYWRETASDGLPEVKSVWALDPDEREAIALGGNILLGITGEPIPPVRLEILSPIDVPAFGMPPLPIGAVLSAPIDEDHGASILVPILLLAAIVGVVGFVLGVAVGRIL